MSDQDQLPMSTTMITLFVVFLLCFGVFTFTQAWFDWPTSAYEPEGNKAEAVQVIDE
jgi:hypothetical protein